MHAVHKGFGWKDIWVSCKLEVVIWKLWYYSLYGTIVVQTRLYGSLFIATTDYVQVDFSNIVYGSCYCGIVAIVCISH